MDADRVFYAEVRADEFSTLQPLPLTITSTTGIYPLGSEREVDLRRSKDTVIDVE